MAETLMDIDIFTDLEDELPPAKCMTDECPNDAVWELRCRSCGVGVLGCDPCVAQGRKDYADDVFCRRCDRSGTFDQVLLIVPYP